MIEAYLDESGVHGTAPICVIAGYFGGARRWAELEAAWRRILKDASIPLEEFHALDFVKTAKYGSVLTDLARAIGDSIKLHPVSVAVVVDDFNSFSEDDRRFLTGASVRLIGDDDAKFTSSGSPNRPYYLPFQHCVKQVASHAQMGGKVNFSFGLHSSFAGYAVELINQIKADPLAPYRDRIGKISTPPAKKTPPLQAADLLAHLTYLDVQERMAASGWDKQPPGLLKICMANRLMQEDTVYYNKACINKTLRAPKMDMRGLTR